MAESAAATAERSSRPTRGTARARLLEAAVATIRTKGYTATTVDDLCAAAGVTKGAFFHHFESKEALAVAAAEHWSAITGALFVAADFHDRQTAAERMLAYVDLRAELVRGEAQEYTCLVGTMAQETFATSPVVRDACAASIFGNARTLEADLAEALADAGHPPGVDAAGLARFTQAAIQGAFILAKAADDPELARECIAHLRRYLELLFHPEHNKEHHHG
jgi:TetR/AcrR family transcriptional repressor of nem operon